MYSTSKKLHKYYPYRTDVQEQQCVFCVLCLFNSELFCFYTNSESFETLLVLKSILFWDITPCRLIVADVSKELSCFSFTVRKSKKRLFRTLLALKILILLQYYVVSSWIGTDVSKERVSSGSSIPRNDSPETVSSWTLNK